MNNNKILTKTVSDANLDSYELADALYAVLKKARPGLMINEDDSSGWD